MKSNYEKIELSKSLFGILMDLDNCCNLYHQAGGDRHITNHYKAEKSKEALKEKIIKLAQDQQ